jgi:hypothetical protein
VSDAVPFIADLKPSGKYVMEDLHAVGGIPAVMKLLLEKGLIHPDELTVTGKTVGENLESAAPLSKGQDVIVAFDKPIKESGHLQVCSPFLQSHLLASEARLPPHPRARRGDARTCIASVLVHHTRNPTDRIDCMSGGM